LKQSLNFNSLTSYAKQVPKIHRVLKYLQANKSDDSNTLAVWFVCTMVYMPIVEVHYVYEKDLFPERWFICPL